MDSSSLIRALKEVPEFSPRLIKLAWEIVDEDGTINPKKAAFHAKELEEAIAEAEEYRRATKEAVRCLKNLARS